MHEVKVQQPAAAACIQFAAPTTASSHTGPCCCFDVRRVCETNTSACIPAEPIINVNANVKTRIRSDNYTTGMSCLWTNHVREVIVHRMP